MSPRTEAGGRAEYTLCHFDTCAGMKGPNDCDCGVKAAILAIEAEAIAARDTELRAAVEAIAFHGDHSGVIPCPQDYEFSIRPMKEAALDLLALLDQPVVPKP